MSKQTRFSRKDVRGHTQAIEEKAKAAYAGGFHPHLKQIFHRRVLALLGVFCFLLLVFTVNLIALQAAGNAFSIYEPTPEVIPVRSETLPLQAPRGEMYDRSGNKLVTNATAYTVLLDYDMFHSVGSAEQKNRTLLTLLDTLQGGVEQPEMTEELFPLVGSYPSLQLSEAATDPSTRTHKALQTVCESLGIKRADAQEIVQYYSEKYALDDRAGGAPLYSDEEIMSLLRLYYNMDRLGVSSGDCYTVASGMRGVDMSTLQAKYLPGVRITAYITRVHLYDGYAAHLLGQLSSTDATQSGICNALGYFVNEINGISGCELAFDRYLQGVDGEILVTYDAYDNVISREILREPVAGQDVYLTVDIELQKIAEDALRINVNTVAGSGDAFSGADCDAGSVVVTDPHTGELLAMASYPTYNDIILLPRSEDEASSAPYINRAAESLYLPGGLFHACTALAGLDRVHLHQTTMLPCDGVYAAVGGDVLCPLYYRYGQTHESLNVSTALCDGCGVFFATLGEQMGVSPLNHYAALLGLGQPTGIEFSEATVSTGTAVGSAAQDAAGLTEQRKCTPLQLCGMLSTLLTGGDRYAVRVFGNTRAYISGAVLAVGKSSVLSSDDLNTDDVNIILNSMRDAARANTLLSSKTATLTASGVQVGYLGAGVPSGTMRSRDALLVAYGIDDATDRAISLSVVLEHGADPALASSTAAEILNAYFAPEN